MNRISDIHFNGPRDNANYIKLNGIYNDYGSNTDGINDANEKDNAPTTTNSGSDQAS